MKSYVLDTDVVVAAFRSNAGASRQLLEAARAHIFDLVLSVPLILEYEAVLTRPEHLEASGGSKADVAAVLNELARISKRATLVTRLRPQLLDAGDEMVLETAVNGEADAIVTLNERHFRPAAGRFGLSVLRPGQALRELEQDADGGS